MADAINRTQTTAPNANLTPPQRNERQLGKEEFLKLLTAQLRLQNPLEPINNEQFVAQLAQFSQVEQLVTMKNLLEQQIQTNLVLSQSITNLSAASLIGKLGTVESARVGWNGTPTSIGYQLALPAKSVTIRIKDSSGTVVRTLSQGSQPSGTYWLTWDGRDDNGNILPQGTYTIDIEARAGDNSPIQTTIFSRGTIEAVRFGENGAQLRINGAEYALGEVVEITAPA